MRIEVIRAMNLSLYTIRVFGKTVSFMARTLFQREDKKSPLLQVGAWRFYGRLRSPVY